MSTLMGVTLAGATAAPSPAAARARRRPLNWVLIAGRALIVTGLGVAAFAGFEVTITGLAEQQAQVSLLSEFQNTIKTTTLDRATSTPTEGSPVAIVEIPKLTLNQVVIEGTTPGDLKAGPGHLRDSPLPGEFGNSVIAGRRTTYAAPFGHLDVLSKNDTIMVTTGQGLFTYVVTSVSRVVPGQPDPVVNTSDSRLTLITSDPAFLATGRLVVTASLKGKPVDVPQRPAMLMSASDLGLSGDSIGLGFGIIWGELLVATMVCGVWLGRRWPSGVVYLLATPVVLALAVLTFTSFDLLLPGTQ